LILLLNQYFYYIFKIFIKMFKKINKIFVIIILIFSNLFLFWINSTQADDCGIWWLCWDTDSIRYCKWNNCWLDTGIAEVKENLWDEIEKKDTASQYIQKIVKYALTFVTLIAVIYIIYAWFRILTSSWEDEVIKNSKKTIIYVIIWIVLIWFAYEIAFWATTIWTEAWKIN